MSHTYGEVLPGSFQAVFQHLSASKSIDGAQRTVFVDVGAGYGDLLFAAAADPRCAFALGVEKYSDKLEASRAALTAEEKKPIRDRVHLHAGDINDIDLLELVNNVGISQRLLIFSNNVAFNTGTIVRFGRKCREIMDSMPLGTEALVISMMDLSALEDRRIGTIWLDTTWSKQHQTAVYGLPSVQCQSSRALAKWLRPGFRWF